MLSEPTNLSDWERDKLKLDFALWLAKRARRYHCERDHILAVIVDVSLPKIEIHEPEVPTPPPDFEHRPAEAKTLAQGPSESEGSGAMQDRCESIAPPIPPETATESTGNVGWSAGRSHSPFELPTGSPASVPVETAPADQSGEDEGEGQPELQVLPDVSARGRGSIVARLRALNAEHPEFTSADAADHLDLALSTVQNNSSANKIKWAKKTGSRGGLNLKVAELNAQHPDWTSTRIAEELDVDPGYVRATAKRLSLTFPGSREEATQNPVETRQPAAAPKPAPAPQPPPASIRPPVASSPSSGSAVVTKPMVRPRGTRFHLRNEAGEYLHFSCEAMTPTKAHAWIGDESHLRAVRRKFEIARDLREVVVPKETRAVA